jgi:hypothetical protein
MKNKTIYVHILKPGDANKPIFIPGITQKVLAAKLFSNSQKVRFEQQANGVSIHLDNITPDKIDTIIQLDI